MYAFTILRFPSDSAVVLEEMELLKNVYLEEMEVTRADCGETQFKFHITPSTADDKDRQYVYLDITVTLTDMVRFSDYKGPGHL